MHSSLPPSASSFFINLTGGLCYIASLILMGYFFPGTDFFILFFVGVCAALLPIFFLEIVFLKVHRRPGVGLRPPGKPDPERVRIKLLGYYASLAAVMLLYLAIPAYSEDDFYLSAFLCLLVCLVIFMVVGWFYISEFDRRFEDPYDSLWHFGNFIAGRWHLVNREKIFFHLKCLLLRSFFLPVMMVYLWGNIDEVLSGHGNFVEAYTASIDAASGIGILKFIVMVYFILASIDVLFGVIGYLVTLRIFDTHIRSVDPYFLGWFVCIVCYYPFSTILIDVFMKDMFDQPEWHFWFKDMPYLIVVWGCFVILAQCCEALTTLTFGTRFCNLAYRSLITTWLFRITKHPQYVSKALNRFFFFMPFMSVYGVIAAFKMMLMFGFFCLIYYLRARTEENHMTRYHPEYVVYANMMNERSIFAPLAKIFPFLKYSEEKALAGKVF